MLQTQLLIPDTLLVFIIVIGCLFLSIQTHRLKPDGYRWYQHTISELGASGTVHETAVAWHLFFPVGVLAAALAFVLPSPNHWIPWGFAVGYLGAAWVPCDRNAPIFGSWKNQLHNGFGAAQYGLFAVAFSKLTAPWSQLGLALLIVFLATLYLPIVRNIRGVLQRAVEFVALGFLIIPLSS